MRCELEKFQRGEGIQVGIKVLTKIFSIKFIV